MTTVNEFVMSDVAAASLGNQILKYRRKWQAIVSKAGVSDKETSDKAALLAIQKIRSWNWSAFFFGMFWFVYRDLKYAWIIIYSWAALNFISSLFPFLERPIVLGEIGVAVLFGLFGNSWLLVSMLEEESHDHLTLMRGRFPWNIGLALVIILGAGFAGTGIRAILAGNG